MMSCLFRTCAVLLVLGQLAWSQTTIVLGTDRDNTLFESNTGALSAGAGDGLFVGVTGNGNIRRGLVHFDIAGNVPAGATIQSVSLTMDVTQGSGAPLFVSLDPAQSDWGEAGSMGTFMGGGAGGPAQPGDATWIHTFSASSFWNNVGGDFTFSGSAGITVSNANGPNTWASTMMTGDVQSWLDNAATNFGWGLLSDEKTAGSARRFATREHSNAAIRPRLSITYTTGRIGSGEDFVLSGSVNAPLGLTPSLTGTANDALFLHLESPMGGYDFFPHILAAQLFVNGNPPFQAPFFPELFLDFSPGLQFPVLYLYSALASPFGTGVLPPGGQTFIFAIPSGLVGMSLMIQGYSTLPSVNTGRFFTATDAFDLTFI